MITSDKKDTNLIGQASEHAQQIINQLQILLADYQRYNQNLRGLHWNITGPDFFVLHAEFESLYEAASERVDLIAERVRKLGGFPLHTFEDYLAHTRIPAAKDIKTSREAVEAALINNQMIIEDLQGIIKLSDEFGDGGTNDMAIEILREVEKNVWMLSAYLT